MTGNEFKSVILPFYRAMYAVAFAILRSEADASDAVQDAVSTLWQRRADLPTPDNPDTFCRVAVRNLCISRLRASADRYFETIDSAIGPPGNESADSEASLHSTTDYIRRILQSFPDKQRRILTFSFISQLSNDEICDITGESSANVRQIISRGRSKLKQLLSNEAN